RVLRLLRAACQRQHGNQRRGTEEPAGANRALTIGHLRNLHHMRTDQPVAIRRLDYTPPAFLVDTVEVAFDLVPERTRVESTSTLRRKPPAAPGAPILLDGEALELEGIWLDGSPLARDRWRLLDDGRLQIEALPDACVLRVASFTVPADNTTLSGLYVS